MNMLADIRNGYVGMAHSSAARAGIQNLTITLALEWARYDVRLNCIAPGTILSTGMRTWTSSGGSWLTDSPVTHGRAMITVNTIAVPRIAR